MNKIKTKWHILGGILLCLAIFCSVVFSAEPARAQTSTTFPVDEAGIAAYVKLDSVDITDITEALNYFYSIEKQDETYVIGLVNVPNPWLWSAYRNLSHLYIGLDGWMVAYYLKDQEASRIMQWNDYEKGAINTTTLQDAIDIMCANIGVAYSNDIKYYNFEFPNANKMTLIAEQIEDPHQSTGDYYQGSFSVVVPGTLYEASYELRKNNSYSDKKIWLCLYIDDAKIFDCKYGRKYGYYDISTYFQDNTPHFIAFKGTRGIATVLIYQN